MLYKLNENIISNIRDSDKVKMSIRCENGNLDIELIEGIKKMFGLFLAEIK